MPRKTPIIQLKDVWKIYPMGATTVQALRGISLEVHEDEFVAIQGPSGSGKSTSVNMVGCLDIPTKGTVLLDGKDISKMTESQLAQIRGQRIGFVFQQFNLIPTLSAIENVMLPMTFQDVPLEKRRKRAIKLLGLVDLSDRANHKPSELSGGEQQRVAISRSLANDPEVVLADEPTGNLDSKTGAMIMNFLKKLNEQGKTIVMVTHDNVLAKKAEKIIFLKDGKIVR